MLKDLLFLVSFYSTDRDRLILKLYCQTIYFKFINDFKACCINYYIISIKILSLTNPRLDWDRGLKWACWGGACCAGGLCPHRDIVNLMIEKGANDWDGGLRGACKGGNRDLVDLMIVNGADDWDGGLEYACMRGHRDIVDLMIQNGARGWDWGLWGACRGGHYDLANFMIQKGANDWNWGLQSACQGGHRDLVNLMIKKGATYCEHCDRNADDHFDHNVHSMWPLFQSLN